MTPRDAGIGNDNLAFRAPTDDGDGGEFVDFVGGDTMEEGVQGLVIKSGWKAWRKPEEERETETESGPENHVGA